MATEIEASTRDLEAKVAARSADLAAVNARLQEAVRELDQLARIDALKDRRELPALLAELQLAAGNERLFFGFSAGQDFADATRQIAFAYAGGLGLPSLDWRDKLMLSWIAPRGIVTAAVASLFALQLNQAQVSGGGALKGLVFLTILLSVSLQGLTAPALAQRLGLVSEAAGDALPGFAAGLEQQPGGEQVGPLEAAE